MNAPIRRPAPLPMSAEQYLAWETQQEEKHEFVDGAPRAMAGGTYAHGLIAQNIAFALRPRLAAGPCRALQEERIAMPRGNYLYADVSVDCGPKAMRDPAAHTPRVVFEVESPTTPFIDEMERIEDYQTVASLAHIVIVSQTRARARIYTHEGEAWRASDIAGLEAEIALPAIGCTLPMGDIYDGVTLEDAPPSDQSSSA